ncbi:MAG: hypothetical protein KDB21_02130 [Acidimicrobiales bacterium]|nr:hypothetical protein [Acidimicrobiales bacterium]
MTIDETTLDEPRTSAGSQGVPTRTAILVLALIGALYLACATWTSPYSVDTLTNAVQSRSLAADRSPIVEEYDDFLEPKYTGVLVWFVDSPRGTTSQYPPGVALWGSLFYLLDPSSTAEPTEFENLETGEMEPVVMDVPSLMPAGLAAVTSVLVAMTFLWLTLRRSMDEWAALAATAVVALGTGAWSVASDQLWQHGPAMMCIAMGTYLASTDRFARSGLAFAFGVLIRPHTAIVAAAIGVTVAVRRRRLGPLVRMGLTSAVGLVLLVAYNRWLWGAWSISGGYGDVFAERAVSGSPLVLARRIVEMLVHPEFGLVIFSPVVVVALVAAAREGRRRAPDWSVGAALGGLIYLLVQLQANRARGGGGFFGYRYPLEALIAAAPLLAICTASWIRDHPKRAALVGALAVASVAIHGFGAVT